MTSSVQSVAVAPPQPLGQFIRRYVGYRMTGFSAGMHRGLPSRHMTFIVSIGSSIDVVAHTDVRSVPTSYQSVLSGLQAGPALLAHNGDQEGVAIEVSPLACRALFGMPARALWNTTVELTDVVGATGGELWERLQGLGDWPDRFAVCDEILTRSLDREATVAPELRHAWQALVRSAGTTSVAELAAAVGWSRQHLTRRFADEFGLGPKVVARVMRLERARRMLQTTPPFVTLAQIAAACGYFDQAHLNRDFAELAQCTPTAWKAEELPFVQDDGATGM